MWLDVYTDAHLSHLTKMPSKFYFCFFFNWRNCDFTESILAILWLKWLVIICHCGCFNSFPSHSHTVHSMPIILHSHSLDWYNRCALITLHVHKIEYLYDNVIHVILWKRRKKGFNDACIRALKCPFHVFNKIFYPLEIWLKKYMIRNIMIKIFSVSFKNWSESLHVLTIPKEKPTF